MAVVSGGADGLACVPFPHFDENPVTLPLAQPSFAPVDHSFPRNYYQARENFIRSTESYGDRDFMSIVDSEKGNGMAHVQTRAANGRKFWAWGNDKSDSMRMNFLSSCNPDCHGSYLEMQAGVAPTQEQTFALGAGSSIEFTEAWVPLQGKKDALGGDYTDAVDAVRQMLDHQLPTSHFLSVDSWLREVSDTGIHRVLAHGTAYGRLHEILNGSRISSGMEFDAATADPQWREWFELLEEGTFSRESLNQVAPQSFMVDWPYINALNHSGSKHGFSWLHHLHLGIALMQQGGSHTPAAIEHFRKSVALKPNPLALHCLGQDELAWKGITALPASALTGHTLDIARDLSGALSTTYRAKQNWTACATLILSLTDLAPEPSAYLLRNQPIRITQAALALYHSSNATMAISLLLAPEGWAVSTPELVPIWQDAWYSLEESKLGKPLNLLDRARVRRSHPPPPSINFNGAT